MGFNMTTFKTNLGRGFSKIGAKTKQAAPDILVVAGVIGVIGAAIYACYETPKAVEILEKRKSDLEAVDICLKDEEQADYDDKMAKADRNRINARTGLELVKTYAVPVGMFGLSLAAILLSHKEMKARNLGLSAALGEVVGEYRNYRKRVQEKVGEEVEQEIYHDLKFKEVEEKVDNPETGKKEKKVVKEYDSCGYSEYAKCFDASSKYWTKDAEYNLAFLKKIESWANERLQKNGKLFLWEVYEALDITPTKASYHVGWLYKPGDESRDNRVDLGIYDEQKEAHRRFVNGLENVIFIDPNVDGEILSQL